MFHVKHEGWQTASALGVELDALGRSRLERFEELIIERGVPAGMIAARDAPRIRERHILDCLRGAPLLPKAGAAVCDLGSGAGLPGIVLAIARADLRFYLVEVRRTRAAFLEHVVGECELKNVAVHPRRVETFRGPVECCTARAFGPAATSWQAASRVLVSSGYLLYWAGSSFDVDRDVPSAVSSRLFRTTALARAGPLVIMARQ